MFLESAAYVGDVLGYYIDAMFKESLLPYAEEKNQVYNFYCAVYWAFFWPRCSGDI